MGLDLAQPLIGEIVFAPDRLDVHARDRIRPLAQQPLFHEQGGQFGRQVGQELGVLSGRGVRADIVLG